MFVGTLPHAARRSAALGKIMQGCLGGHWEIVYQIVQDYRAISKHQLLSSPWRPSAYWLETLEGCNLNLLLIDDDQVMSTALAEDLRGKGHAVDLAHDGMVGLSRARIGNYSALIVDRTLPHIDGLTLVRNLRTEGIQTPVLFLTAVSGLDDRVAGLNSGGDDYLAKPFAFVELLARLSAIVRRVNTHSSRVTYQDLTLDLLDRTARRSELMIDLQPMEFKLLLYFFRNAERIVTRNMLLENVWDIHFVPEPIWWRPISADYA